MALLHMIPLIASILNDMMGMIRIGGGRRFKIGCRFETAITNTKPHYSSKHADAGSYVMAVFGSIRFGLRSSLLQCKQV